MVRPGMQAPAGGGEHKLTIEGYCHACGCFPDSCDLSAHLDEFETHHHHPEEPDAQEEANP